jgi:hypothetical protein
MKNTSDLAPGMLAGIAPQKGEDPKYPAPWTTTQPREALRDTDKARVVSLLPDVCLTPRGNMLVPVPYNIHDLVGHDTNFANSVNFTGERAMVFRSKTEHVHGNEQGTGGGIKSGTTPGQCEPIDHASQLRAEGSWVIRHQDKFWMNNRNTIGEGRFVRDTKEYKEPKDTDPVPGSARLKSSGVEEAGLPSDKFMANTVLAQAAPLPSYPPPATVPAPSAPTTPPNNVIYPKQWHSPPPQPEVTPEIPGKGYAKYLRFGPWAAAAAIILTPSSTAPPWMDELPQNDFERQLFEKARELDKQGVDKDKITEWFNGERRNQPKPTEKEAPRPAAEPQAVTGARERGRERPCLVGPYEDIRSQCNAQGGQAHHIVPDYALRFGNRSEGEVGLKRIDGMPSLQRGPAICLTGPAGTLGTEHNEAHIGDRAIEQLGQRSMPPGTAPIGTIIPIAQAATTAARPDCAAKIAAAVKTGFAGVDRSTLGRTTRLPPAANSPTAEALSKGVRRGGIE